MPPAQEHHLAVKRTARYFVSGHPSGRTRHVWLVVHGYGQLAQYFVRHFAALTAADDTLAVVAPEALSRFYLQGTGGRIGASWMTREDRLTEINDYIAYLDQVAETILAACSPTVRITVLGFSQGAATVSRWLARGRLQPHRLVLWAGAFPPDVEFTVATHLLRRVPITLVCGTQDGFITEDDFGAQQTFLRELGCEPAIKRFEGRHELHAGTLRELHAAEQAH